MSSFFSIIISTFNRPDKLIRAIDSVLNQEFQDFELIIVNDGSTVDYSLVEKHIESNNKIKYFYKINEERSIARNFGIKHSSGRFICLLDDDDYYLTFHLKVIYDEIVKNNYKDGLYHTYSIIKEKNGDENEMKILPKKESYTEQEYYLTDGLMTVNSSCFSRDVFIEFPFDDKLKFAEDHNQRLRAMHKYQVFRIYKHTNIYDKSGETSTNKKDLETLLEYIKSWKYNFKNNEIKQKVSKKIKKLIVLNYYHLILNYHRPEISYLLILKIIINILITNFTIKTLSICFKSFIWKLQKL